MTAIRYALRSLRRSPGFTVTAILTLTLGIAAMTAMFALVHGVLLAPLPYGDAERLVSVKLRAADGGDIGLPPALQAFLERDARSLQGVGIHRTGSTNVWIEGDDDGADSVIGTWVNASMTALLRTPPLLGRGFTAEEELRGGPDAVLLGEAEWRDRFGASPDVIGQTLMVNSVRRQIVGVMPARFSFPTAATRLWLPAKRADDGSVGDPIYAGVARLADGATPAQARDEIAAILPRLADAYPRLQTGASTASWLAEVHPTPDVVPLREDIASGIAPTLWLLAAAAALVLCVAWANVGNLLLVRADVKEAELAIRAAIGAGRSHVALLWLTEALLLGAAAAALALPLASGAIRALVAFGPPGIPRLSTLGLGVPVVVFLLAITAASIVVCAAVPAARGWRRRAMPDLRDGARGATAGATRMRVRAVLAALQIAMALVVITGSAVLLRTAFQLARVDPGFDGTHVVSLRLQLPFARYDETAAIAFYARLLDEVRALPSVAHAGLASKIPLGSGPDDAQTFRFGIAPTTRSVPVTLVDDGYFDALAIPLLAGRGYRRVGAQEDHAIVISRRAAAELLGDDDPAASLDKALTLAWSDVRYTVIGVVGDVRHRDLTQAPDPLVYRPLVVPSDPRAEPSTPRNLALLVRSVAPMETVLPALRRVVHGIDASVPVYDVQAMFDVVGASTAKLRLLLVLMTAAAITTLVLALIGLYGLMAYRVALRTREFGVRLALGAAPARIARLVAGHGLALTGVGLAMGLATYAIAAPVLRRWLYGVTPSDPAALLASTMLIAAAAALACFVPARKAARVPPASALRAN